MSLFESVKDEWNVYSELLGYYYQTDILSHPEKLEEINNCDFVFVSSDNSDLIEGCLTTQFMTSAEHPGSYMWLEKNFVPLMQLPNSGWTDVPTVGFV